MAEQTTSAEPIKVKEPPSIWWYALGYFAVYIPYTFFLKLLTDGTLPKLFGDAHQVVQIRPGCVDGVGTMCEGAKAGIDGLVLLPFTGFVSMVGMFIFLTAMGWWKYAGRKKILGRSVPCPSKWTFLSGLGSSVVIATTTLSYTFGIAIVIMMLFMRGGMLAMAPIVDVVSGRKPKKPAIAATCFAILAIAAGALWPIFTGKGSLASDKDANVFAAVICVAFYLFAYFIRMYFMSKRAKSDDPNATYQYFVEEQMTSTPMLVLILGVLALIGAVTPENVGQANLKMITAGFGLLFTKGSALILILCVIIGVMSQGNGIFGGLILLDKRDNTFCVPVNRASSVLAGVISTLCLMIFVDSDKYVLGGGQIVGAILLICALSCLSVPPLIKKLKAKKEAEAQAAADKAHQAQVSNAETMIMPKVELPAKAEAKPAELPAAEENKPAELPAAAAADEKPADDSNKS